MRSSFSIAFIIFTFSCQHVQQRQKTVLPSDFGKEFSIDTSIQFQDVTDVAYGYNIAYPTDFKEVMDTIGQVDSFILYSPNRQAKIKFFVEGDIHKNKTSQDKSEQTAFKLYFDSLNRYKHVLIRNSKIIERTYNYKAFEYGNPAKCSLIADIDTSEFILETELSEVPISGDLTFKSFVMRYPKARKSYYRPIAIEIAKRFGQ